MKIAFSMLSPGGAGGRLSIFIFHRVLPVPDPLFPGELDASRFDEILAWLNHWFQVLPLSEAGQRLLDGTLPARAAALTFDDGYADNHDVALPLLRKHELPCSFFIATAFLNGGRMWNDGLIESVRLSPLHMLDLRGVPGLDRQLSLDGLGARKAAITSLIDACKYMEHEERVHVVDLVATRAEAVLPVDLMMDDAKVRALAAAGMELGGHTHSHPILARLDERQAGDEIARGKRELESLIGRPLQLFAYPNGKPGADYLPQRDPGLVRELGFETAVSTTWGAGGRNSDRLQLPRFTPWDRQRWKFALRLMGRLRAPPP